MLRSNQPCWLPHMLLPETPPAHPCNIVHPTLAIHDSNNSPVCMLLKNEYLKRLNELTWFSRSAKQLWRCKLLLYGGSTFTAQYFCSIDIVDTRPTTSADWAENRDILSLHCCATPTGSMHINTVPDNVYEEDYDKSKEGASANKKLWSKSKKNSQRTERIRETAFFSRYARAPKLREAHVQCWWVIHVVWTIVCWHMRRRCEKV